MCKRWIIRAGLGFKKCDVAIVTNVAADHLGLKGIHTIEQLAKVKGCCSRNGFTRWLCHFKCR